jgi:hypothetical protein
MGKKLCVAEDLRGFLWQFKRSLFRVDAVFSACTEGGLRLL